MFVKHRIKPDGNCLFRAISYCIYSTEDKHREIRLSTIDKIVNEWDLYRNFVVDVSYSSSVNSAEDYKNLLSTDGEFGGSVELTCMSRFFSDYLFRVHYENSSRTVDYGTGNIVCNLLFSGNYDAGHFDVLQHPPVAVTADSLCCSADKISLLHSDNRDEIKDSLEMRRNKRNVQDDSDEESETGSATPDSDATVYNPRARNKKQPLPQQKRGRPVRRKNAKRARVSDDSESDTSPQPSTSGLANNSQSSPNDSGNNSSENESESESDDSDYGPVKDVSLRKKNLSQGKRGRAPKKGNNGKKQKAQNNSVNGVTSKKASQTRNHLNTSNRKNVSNDVSFDAKQIENLAQKLVYFLLIEDQKKYAIKRKAITTHVFKDEAYSPKLYTAVIKKANFILKKVYGMEIMELENQKDSYLIVNILKRELGIHDYYDVSRLKQQQHGLILYLLTIIFMNDNVITEEELTKSLQPLGIDLTSKRVHPIFGDVKKYITTELVKQMYLSYELISRDPPKYEIKWGIRAKQEFDKRDLLQFTCQIMADTTPESWKIQYKDAEKSATPQVNGKR